jgi:hypothetical protein
MTVERAAGSGSTEGQYSTLRPSPRSQDWIAPSHAGDAPLFRDAVVGEERRSLWDARRNAIEGNTVPA